MLFGQQETPTMLAWASWENALTFLAGKDWVEIGGRYSVEAYPSTLNGFVLGYVSRSAASWVAAVLEAAQLVAIDRGVRPESDCVEGRNLGNRYASLAKALGAP